VTPSLIPRLFPSFLSHTEKIKKQFDYVHDDVLCVVWVIEISPMHTVLLERLTVLETELSC